MNEPGGEHSFIQDELEEVSLTEEEIEDVRENFIVQKEFENFGDSESESETRECNSSDTDSDSARPQRQCPAGDYLTTRIRKLTLKHRDEEPTSLYSFSDLAKYSPSQWNDLRSQEVYQLFKVHSYIVDPNFLLSVGKLGSPPLHRFTMDNLLPVIGPGQAPTGSGALEFPRWVDVKDALRAVLDVFDGCEGIPNALDDPVTTANLIQTFKFQIVSALKNHRGNAQVQFLKDLQSIHSKLLQSLKKKGTDKCKTPLEAVSEDFISSLIEYFRNITNVTLRVLPKSNIPLDLSSTRGTVCGVSPEPDFQIKLDEEIILVGEVKKFGNSPLHLLKHKGHRVKEEKSSEHTPQSDVQKENERKQDDAVSTETVNKENSGNSSGASGMSSSLKSPTGQPPKEARHYRHLDANEQYKMRSFLPQLIAEMLACRSSSKKFFHIGRLNENVQMGFSMEGFKLRFVRMVLRDTSAEKLPPTVKDLVNDSRVKCEVYLTQEFNLFKKNHIVMIFQILLAVSYCCVTYIDNY